MKYKQLMDIIEKPNQQVFNKSLFNKVVQVYKERVTSAYTGKTLREKKRKVIKDALEIEGVLKRNAQVLYETSISKLNYDDLVLVLLYDILLHAYYVNEKEQETFPDIIKGLLLNTQGYNNLIEDKLDKLFKNEYKAQLGYNIVYETLYEFQQIAKTFNTKLIMVLGTLLSSERENTVN